MLLLRSYEETHPSRCEFSGEKGVVLVCSSTACAGELLVLGMRKGGEVFVSQGRVFLTLKRESRQLWFLFMLKKDEVYTITVFQPSELYIISTKC